MSFENWGNKPERSFSGEANDVNAEMVRSLQEASPEERATFLDLKELERSFFSQNL